MKSFLVIISVLAFALLLLFLLINNLPLKKQDYVVHKIDTIIKIIPQKEIKIVEAKPKIKFILDTIIQTKPFVATIDTVIVRDTLYAQFMFPDNLMSINVRRSSDSVLLPQITIEKTKYERNWYETAAAFGGGLILGLIIGK